MSFVSRVEGLVAEQSKPCSLLHPLFRLLALLGCGKQVRNDGY
jgi:hypothetical protein